jgi:hypothetical protein
MKKVILALSGILIVAFVIVMVANASAGTQQVKKATTEVSKDCAKCPSAASCAKKEVTSADAAACAAKCKEAGADHANCKDAAACKEKAAGAACEKKCEGTTPCKMSEKK